MRNELADLREHLDRYRQVTLQVLECVTDEQLAWRPASGHFSLGQQLIHIAQAEDFHSHGLFENDWDMNRARLPKQVLSRAEVRSQFGRVRQYTDDRLDGLTIEDLSAIVPAPGSPIELSLRSGLWFILEHELHHKGQIWLYLRMMGIRAPFYAYPLPLGERPDIAAREELGGF